LIRSKSPTSLKLALAQVRRGSNWSFSECMRMEFRIVSRVIHAPDFYEGVRAAVIDKDQRPVWRPATLAQVSDAAVEGHFAPLADQQELQLP
jgi:enoyl-CoA hydratase